MPDREQRLRLALKREAEHVRVSPELHRRVRSRLRPSRGFRSRAVKVSVAAAVVAVGVVLWIVAGTRVVREDVTGPAPTDTYFAGYWPVSSRAEAEAMQERADAGEDTWRRDPERVARAYGESLGWDVAHVIYGDQEGRRSELPPGYTDAIVAPRIGEGTNKIVGPDHRILMVSLEGAGLPVWFVAGIEGATIVVDEPRRGDRVGSPLRARGTAHTFEGNVRVTIVDDDARKLGQTPLTAGGTEPAPFEGSIEFTDPSSPSGVVKFEGDSGIGGPSTDVTIVRVRFAERVSVSPAPTPGATPVASNEFADEAFRCIVSARHYRDLEMAKPCMTERWSSSIADPVEFIGASSPGLERSTIVSSSRSVDGIVYDALSYWGRTDALEFVSEDTITLVAEDGEWRADSWQHGEMTPIGDTMSVTLRFLALGDTPKCDGDVPAPESFVSIDRVVPSEPVIDDLALSVVRELLTGVFAFEGDGAGTFAGGTRVSRVSVADGTATVELNRLTRRLGTCDFALTALRQTLTTLEGITDVEVREAPAQEPIEPDV